MAKAILEFDLADPDDRLEHKRAIASLDMALALWQIVTNSQKEIEYAIEAKEHKGETVSPYEANDMYRELIGEISAEHGINIDELVN